MAITMDGIFVNGQKVTFHPENILTGDASAYTEEIGTAVEEWLEENVTGGEQVTDTTLTLAGVPADSKKAGDEISSLKEDLNVNVVNLTGGIDITNQYKQGYIAVNTGTVDVTSTHPKSTSDKYALIECAEGDVFQLKGEGGNATKALYAWVKADGTKLAYSGSGVTYADYTEIVAPANTKYLVSNVEAASAYGLVQGKRIRGDFDALGVATTDWNLYVDSTAVDGYLSATGELTEPSKGERTSDYIAVSVGDVLNVRTWATSGSNDAPSISICTYDSSKAFITRNSKNGSNGQMYFQYIYTVPSGVSYVRIVGRLYSDGRMMMTKGTYDLGYIPAFKDFASAVEVENLNSGIDDLDDGIASVTGNSVLTGGYTDGYIPVNTSSIDVTNVQKNADNKHIVVNCSAGEIYNIIGKGDSYTKGLYIFVDASGNKVSGGEAEVTYTNFKQFIVPTNAVKFVSNVNANYPYALVKGKILADRVTALETASGAETGMFSPFLRPAMPRFMMHRGLQTEAPENTIPAFELAGQGGAWGIETDVYETTDGYFVLSHDDDVSRMTDGTGKITEMTYAQTQECTIDAGSNIEQYPDLKMPLLEDYLAICRRYGCVPVIEIKGVTNYDNLVDTIKSCGMEGSSTFTFYYDTDIVSNIRLMTSMPIILIGSLNADLEDLVDYATTFSDLWVNIYSTTVTDAIIKYAHEKNVPIGMWQTDNESTADIRIRQGIDFVTSNSITHFTDS